MEADSNKDRKIKKIKEETSKDRNSDSQLDIEYRYRYKDRKETDSTIARQIAGSKTDLKGCKRV